MGGSATMGDRRQARIRPLASFYQMLHTKLHLSMYCRLRRDNRSMYRWRDDFAFPAGTDFYCPLLLICPKAIRIRSSLIYLYDKRFGLFCQDWKCHGTNERTVAWDYFSAFCCSPACLIRYFVISATAVT